LDFNIHRTAFKSGSETLAGVTYQKNLTGLLVIDPYNDFISPGGKVWDRIVTADEVVAAISHRAWRTAS
jgi:hypothetical protein